MGDACLLFLAYRGGRPIAGALNFIGADTLYGRYWGAIEERAVPPLRAELLSRHRMGDRPSAWPRSRPARRASINWRAAMSRSITRSAHFLPDPGFRRAVADFLGRERRGDRGGTANGAREALPYRSSLVVDRDLPAVRRRLCRGTCPAVVKPQAASPDGATAISPPLPPSALMSASDLVERLLQRLRRRAGSASHNSCAATARMKNSPEPGRARPPPTRSSA